MNANLVKIIFLSFIAVVFSSCKETDLPTDEEKENLPKAPIITGMKIKDATGSIRGEWGISNEKTEHEMMQIIVYPNPFNDHCYFDLSGINNKSVKAYIQSAVPDTALVDKPEDYSSDGKIIKVLHQGRYDEEKLFWNTENEQGEKVPASFYRFYIEIDQQDTLWLNLFIYREISDVPSTFPLL